MAKTSPGGSPFSAAHAVRAYRRPGADGSACARGTGVARHTSRALATAHSTRRTSMKGIGDRPRRAAGRSLLRQRVRATRYPFGGWGRNAEYECKIRNSKFKMQIQGERG